MRLRPSLRGTVALSVMMGQRRLSVRMLCRGTSATAWAPWRSRFLLWLFGHDRNLSRTGLGAAKNGPGDVRSGPGRHWSRIGLGAAWSGIGPENDRVGLRVADQFQSGKRPANLGDALRCFRHCVEPRSPWTSVRTLCWHARNWSRIGLGAVSHKWPGKCQILVINMPEVI